MGTLHRVTVAVAPELTEIASAVLFEAGAQGLEEQDDGARLVTYLADEGAAEALGDAVREALGDAATVTLSVHDDEDWQTRYHDHLRPVFLGEGFVLQPADRPVDPVPDRRTLMLGRHAAFGEGDHATTQLAGSAVEAYCRAHPGCRVADVGTGTGVLALVARSCGAASVDAVDTDPSSVEAARDNAHRNALTAGLAIATGSAADLQGPYDLVVANILATVLHELVGPLLALAKPAAGSVAPGRLLLTGCLEDQADGLADAFEAAGARPRKRAQLEGWTLLELDVP